MSFYFSAAIRTVVECACALFHRSLSGYLIEELERIQKRAMASNLGHARADDTANETKNVSQDTLNYKDFTTKTDLRVNVNKIKENSKNVATVEKSILLILCQFESLGK